MRSIRCGPLLPSWRGLFVCLLITTVNPTKTVEPIEMSFELRTCVCLGDHVLGSGPDTLRGRGSYEEHSLPAHCKALEICSASPAKTVGWVDNNRDTVYVDS